MASTDSVLPVHVLADSTIEREAVGMRDDLTAHGVAAAMLGMPPTASAAATASASSGDGEGSVIYLRVAGGHNYTGHNYVGLGDLPSCGWRP